MALHRFKCSKCGEQFSSLKKAPLHCEQFAEKLLVAPQAKFMEPQNKDRGTSSIKDQKKILMERAKDHARLNDYDDLTQTNNTDMAKRLGWVREDGSKRKKLDDR